MKRSPKTKLFEDGLQSGLFENAFSCSVFRWSFWKRIKKVAFLNENGYVLTSPEPTQNPKTYNEHSPYYKKTLSLRRKICFKEHYYVTLVDGNKYWALILPWVSKHFGQYFILCQVYHILDWSCTGLLTLIQTSTIILTLFLKFLLILTTNPLNLIIHLMRFSALRIVIY